VKAQGSPRILGFEYILLYRSPAGSQVFDFKYAKPVSSSWNLEKRRQGDALTLALISASALFALVLVCVRPFFADQKQAGAGWRRLPGDFCQPRFALEYEAYRQILSRKKAYDMAKSFKIAG
jgi:hypothetical protein